jgi:uncharacterized membrane protein YheB (UPF0754 family)
MTQWLWTLPVVGALVGYGTNWLAVRMLFRPRKRIFGIQGLIPKRRTEIATKIAATVERELIRPADIEAMLSDPDLHASAEKEIDLRVREFLARKVDELPTLALVMLPVDLEDRLRRSIVKHVMESLPEISKKLGAKLTERLSVRKLVEDRVNAFEDEQLERLVLDIARRELHAIEFLGGFLGAAIGGIQWLILWLAV